MYKVLVCCFNPRSLNNIHHGFIQAGCRVRPLFFDLRYAGRTEELVKCLMAAIDEFRPDFVFSYGWWDIGIELPAFLEAVGSRGLFHIYWAYDDPVCFENISMPFAAGVDLLFTTVEECLPEYGRRGIKALPMPHGCLPLQHKRVACDERYRHDIVLLANDYNIEENPEYSHFRIKGMKNMISPLTSGGFDFKVWGLWWTQWDRYYLLPEQYYGGVLSKGYEPLVYSSCKIALGLQTVGNSASHCSARTFEVMGCGGFHLSQYSPALETYFKKGIHMEWSKSADETLEIVKFYLKNESARSRIALKGQQEVYEKHTLLHRIRAVLQAVESFLTGS